jgi:hypothetical protein
MGGAATTQLGQNVPDHASLPVPLRTHRCYRWRSQAAQWRTSGISSNALREPGRASLPSGLFWVPPFRSAVRGDSLIMTAPTGRSYTAKLDGTEGVASENGQ